MRKQTILYVAAFFMMDAMIFQSLAGPERAIDAGKSLPVASLERGIQWFFKTADRNQDELISREEACAHAPRLCAMFNAIDEDGDGYLTPDEFHRFYVRLDAAERRERLLYYQKLVQGLDKDGDGLLSRDEVKNESEIAPFFGRMDANKDGYLSAEELKNWRPRKNVSQFQGLQHGLSS